MPSNIELTLTMKRDGKLIAGFPMYRRLQVDEAQAFNVEQASGGGYVTLPITSIDTLQMLLLNPSRQVTVRLNGQSAQGLIINAGGLLLFVDATVTAGASVNATIDNASGNTAVLEGLAGGT